MDKFGNDLPPDAEPTGDMPLNDNDWYPFADRIEFEMGEFLFTENQMPQSHVDKLMWLWTASMLRHNDQAPYSGHADLHQVIDAILHGDIPWKLIQVHYAGNIPELAAAAPSWMKKVLKFLFCHYCFLHLLVPSLFVHRASLHKHGVFSLHR